MGRYYGQFNPPVDRVIESYFPPGYIGAAVDVGAVDGVYLSNTLHFEELGWDVVCIEANPVYAEALRRNRKRALNCAVADRNEDNATFHVVKLVQMNDYSAISALKLDQQLLQKHKELGFTCQESDVPVNVRTLDRCLEEMPLARIDFASIDVEGGELAVLKGFDIARWKPPLLVIESNSLDHAKPIADYLKDFGYQLHRRLEVNDFFVAR